jgi:hypothetical protein
MYLADFKCEKCNCIELDIPFKDYNDFCNFRNSIRCKKCTSVMEQVMTVAPHVEIKEGSGPISNKPMGYWRNAERNRQISLKKRREMREKNNHET